MCPLGVQLLLQMICFFLRKESSFSTSYKQEAVQKIENMKREINKTDLEA